MKRTLDTLAEFLAGSGKIAFLGAGSPLRADDSIGLYIVEGLEKRLKSDKNREIRFYLGESAPENFSGAIRDFGPTHLVIFDAAEMDQAPGYITTIQPAEIGGVSFSTHMLPLKILVEYLTATIGCEVMVVGVQPKSLDFAMPVSAEVTTAADEFVNGFKAMIK
jgi:hydrogenase 3 maturation protease